MTLKSKANDMDKRRLSAHQRRKLTTAVKRVRDTRQYRRVLAVLQADAGQSTTDIARTLRVSRQSVHNWIAGFHQTYDTQALADAPRCGRPVRWNAPAQSHLQALLQSSPQQWGYFATQWTVALLQQQLGHATGQHYSARTLRRGLHGLGYVWKRARYELMPDPQREKKTPNLSRRQWLATAQRAAG